MAQFLRPDSDVALGSWTTSPLFSKINETTSNDTPLIVSPQQTLTAMEVGLSDAIAPNAGTRTLRVRARKTNTQQRGLNWSLKVNGTSVQSGTILADLPTTFTTYAITITGAISDYTQVSVELTATGSTGGGGATRSDAEVSWMEFEIPDAAPASYDESVTLSSDSALAEASTAEFGSDVTFDSDTVVDALGGKDIEGLVDLTIDSTITNAGDVTEPEAPLTTFDNTFDTTFAKIQTGGTVYDESLTLGADSDFAELSDLLAELSIDLSGDSVLTEESELVTEPSLNLTGDVDISVTGGADVDESITLTTDNDLTANSDLSTEGSLTLSTDNQLNSVSELVMDGSVSMDSGAGFDEQNIAVIETVRTFLSDNTIEFSDEAVVELVVTLTSVSGLTLENIIDYLNEVSLTSNHSNIYESFVDYLGNIILISEHFNIFSSQGDLEGSREFSTNHTVAFDILTDYFNSLNIEGFTEIVFQSVLELQNLINLTSNSNINIQSDAEGFQESVVLSCRAWFMRLITGSVWDSTFDQSFGIEEYTDINLAEVDMFPEISLPVDSETDQNSVAEFHNTVDLDSDADTGDTSDGVLGNVLDLISEHLILFDLEMDDVFNENRTLTAEGQILFDILGNYVGSLGLTVDVSDFYNIVSELVGELNLSSGSTIQFDTNSTIEKSLTLSANARIRFVGLLKGRLTIIGSKWIKGPKNIR